MSNSVDLGSIPKNSLFKFSESSNIVYKVIKRAQDRNDPASKVTIKAVDSEGREIGSTSKRRSDTQVYPVDSPNPKDHAQMSTGHGGGFRWPDLEI